MEGKTGERKTVESNQSMESTTVQSVPTTSTIPPSTTNTTTTNTSTTFSSQTPFQNSSTPNTHIPSSSTINNTTFNPKKRGFDHVGCFQSSPYFKLRALLKEIRPLFLEVLRAPDIQNFEAGRGIQEKMKLMIDLCKQKTAAENPPLVKCNNGAGGQDFASEQKPVIRPSDQPSQGYRSFVRPTVNNPEKQTHEGNKIPGTYIVGGSAFGWNFITFHGTKPEYYGRTKEAFRAANAI